MLLDPPFHPSDLLVEGGNDFVDRGCDDGRVRRLRINRLLRSGRFEMLVTACKRL